MGDADRPQKQRRMQSDKDKATGLFLQNVAPYLKDRAGLSFTLGENDAGQFAQQSDMIDGIDAIITLRDGSRHHCALRIQWIGHRDWGTVTERLERITTGMITEYPKREKAMETGGIMATMGLQAYVDEEDGTIYGVYIYKVADLHEWIAKQPKIQFKKFDDPVYISETSNDGRTVRFYIIKVGPMQIAGYTVRRYSQTSDRLTEMLDRSGIWSPPRQGDLFPGQAAMP